MQAVQQTWVDPMSAACTGPKASPTWSPSEPHGTPGTTSSSALRIEGLCIGKNHLYGFLQDEGSLTWLQKQSEACLLLLDLVLNLCWCHCKQHKYHLLGINPEKEKFLNTNWIDFFKPLTAPLLTVEKQDTINYSKHRRRKLYHFVSMPLRGRDSGGSIWHWTLK